MPPPFIPHPFPSRREIASSRRIRAHVVRATVVAILAAFGGRPMPGQTVTAAPQPVSIESLPERPRLSPVVMAKLGRLTPIFNGRNLDGWIQAPEAPFRFAREDLIAGERFAHRLLAQADPFSAFLLQAFDDDGGRALAQLADSTGDARQAVSVVLRNLNRLNTGVSLYDPKRCAAVVLRAETSALLRLNLSGLRLARANRLLLEDAFAPDLRQSPASGWIARDGLMASTGAGRGSIYTTADYTRYRLVFQVRQSAGNHVPGILIFGTRPPPGDDLAAAQAGVDALGGIQLQVPNGGHWDYRPGINQAGNGFTRPHRIRFNLQAWAQVEVLVDANKGAARMAVAQPPGHAGIELLRFNDPSAGRPGPIALQMHNAGLFDEFRDLRVEIDPPDDRLLIVE